MRKYILAVLVIVTYQMDGFAAQDERLQNARAKRAAVDLLRAGASAAAVAHLKQNLRPENGVNGEGVALVQSLIELAGLFYNRREMSLAREAAVQAVRESERVKGSGSGVASNRWAEIYLSLGTLYEIVIFDLRAAQNFYEAANALAPHDEFIKRRRNAVIEKQKLRGGAGR